MSFFNDYSLSLQVSHVNTRQVELSTSGEDIKLVPNIQAVIEDFSVIGSELVHKVEKLK